MKGIQGYRLKYWLSFVAGCTTVSISACCLGVERIYGSFVALPLLYSYGAGPLSTNIPEPPSYFFPKRNHFSASFQNSRSAPTYFFCCPTVGERKLETQRPWNRGILQHIWSDQKKHVRVLHHISCEHQGFLKQTDLLEAMQCTSFFQICKYSLQISRGKWNLLM